MARRRQKAFVPRQKPKKYVRKVKRVETTIASIERIYDENDNAAEIKMTFEIGSRYTLKRNVDEAFYGIFFNAWEGDPITLVTHASKIIAVEYYC